MTLPRARRRRRLVCFLQATLALVALMLPLTHSDAIAEPAPDALSIMEKTLHQGFARKSYELRIQLLRNDPTFLEACLAPFEQDGLRFAYLDGKVTWVEPDHFDIWLHPRGHLEMESHFASDDGFNLSLVSTEGFTPGGAPKTSASTVASASPSTNPSSDASSTPVAAESPSPLPEAAPPTSDASIPAGNPDAMRQPYRYHPLTLLWPFQLKKTPTSVSFTLAGDEPLGGRPCWKINRVADVTMTLWIAKDDYSVVQIEYDDPTSGKLVRFNATSFFTVQPDAGEPNQVPMLTFGQATISAGLEPMCDVTALTAPGLVPVPSSSATAERETPKVAPIAAPQPKATEPRVLQGIWVVVVFLLVLGLGWYGGRYALYLSKRQLFSKDLIVLDDLDASMGRALQALGFTTVPASMEVLTEERNHVGKKYEANVLPRAVVVAPHAIGQAKNYLFLLRAFVEEGGRILIFDHGKADLNVLPYRMYTVPNSGEKVSLHAKPNVWKRLREEDVETKTGHLLPREFVVEVNQKRADIDLVHALNRASGVRTTVVGVVRAGKGEYIICQYLIADDLKKSKLETSPITRLLVLDLIDYLQGRTKLKEAAPSPVGSANGNEP